MLWYGSPSYPGGGPGGTGAGSAAALGATRRPALRRIEITPPLTMRDVIALSSSRSYLDRVTVDGVRRMCPGGRDPEVCVRPDRDITTAGVGFDMEIRDIKCCPPR